MNAKERIIVPLDTSNIELARDWALALRNHVGMFKIGLEFVSAFFTEMLTLPHEHALKRLRHTQEIFSAGMPWMLDLKLHDISNTMKGALRAIRALNPAFITVHASAGPLALAQLAKEKGNAKLLAVTVLTSLESWECHRIFGANPPEKVLDLAIMARDAGVDGVVCSPLELSVFDANFWQNFLKITPGVRPAWYPANDQKRMATPAEAIWAGADYLVIGRPIINPPLEIGSPREAVERIVEEIESVQQKSPTR